MSSYNPPSPLVFFSHLRWLDRRPLLDVIEPYRRQLFMRALYEFREDGSPHDNLILADRAKKNWKSADLVLAGFYHKTNATEATKAALAGWVWKEGIGYTTFATPK
jgi:hypothetical protein